MVDGLRGIPNTPQAFQKEGIGFVAFLPFILSFSLTRELPSELGGPRRIDCIFASPADSTIEANDRQ